MFHYECAYSSLYQRRTDGGFLGGTMPEDLPTPDKNLKELENSKMCNLMKGKVE